jgi:hypothetical protein
LVKEVLISLMDIDDILNHDELPHTLLLVVVELNVAFAFVQCKKECGNWSQTPPTSSLYLTHTFKNKRQVKKQ